MKNLTTFTKVQLEKLTLKEITAQYNLIACELLENTVKKFRDKPTAIKRTLDLQKQLPKKEAPKEKEAPKSKFDMDAKISTVEDCGAEGTIENSLHAAIASGCDTVQKVVDHIVKHHKRPRSGLGVDAQYAIHNIKWFVKKSHLKLGK